VGEASPDHVKAVVADLDRLLAANLDAARLEAIVRHDLSCAYYPPGDGMSYPDWLHWLRGRLAGGKQKS